MNRTLHLRRVCHKQQDHAFGVMFDALESLQPGDVYICTGASPSYACWGELMSTAARHRGALGAVIEGDSRDTEGIRRHRRRGGDSAAHRG